VLVDCQDHVIACAQAWIEKTIADAFAEAVARHPGGPNRDVLDDLCSLYILAVIERDRGWFQEHGRLSSTRSKAIRKCVNGLCAKLRPHAAALVDAFGVPVETLGDAEQVAVAEGGRQHP
jgi:acyl-CoA oxidase